MPGNVERQFGGRIQRAVTQLLLGRVLLKADASSGDSTIRLGERPVDRLSGSGQEIIGNGLWLHKTTEAKICVPGTVGNPPAASHEYNIEWSGIETSDGSAEPSITTTLDQDYSTSDGCYVSLRDDVLSELSYLDDLKVAAERAIAAFLVRGETAELERVTPGILVRLISSTDAPIINTVDNSYDIRIWHWWKLSATTDDGYETMTRLDEIIGMLSEDHNIGGTVEDTIGLEGGDLPNRNEAALFRSVGLDVVEVRLRVTRREQDKQFWA